METQDPYKAKLRRQLLRILAKTAALRFASGMLGFLAVGAWVFLCVILWAVVADSPPMWQAFAASHLALVIFAGLFFYFVLLPLIRLPSLGKLAAQVEDRKDLKDILRAGYEFAGDEEAGRRYAPDLVREVIRWAVQSITGLEIRFLFLTRRTLALVPIAYGALAVLLLFALVKPALLFDAGKRVIDPMESAAMEHAANLFVTPGDVTVLSGSDVEVIAMDFGEAEQPVQLSYNLMNGFWKTEPTTPSDPDDGGAFKKHAYTFKNLRNSISYYFVSAGRKSATHTINVVNKPIVTNLTLTLTPPAYTGEPPLKIEDGGGNVKALEGTHVAIEGTSNNFLSDARVRFDEGKSRKIHFEAHSFQFDFTALKDGYYAIFLEDTLHYKTDGPLMHTIEVFDDHPPSLDVLEPSDDPELPRNYRVNLSFIASDDYGVNDAAVFHRKGGDEGFRKTPIPLGDQVGKKDIGVAFVWSLEGISLFPGNYIEFYIEVKDNNVVTGPGTAKSRVFVLSAPTMAELYEKVREEEAERSALFEEAIQEGKALKERLEKLEREFIKTEKLEWSQKKEIDKAVASQQSIEQKIEEIQKSLNESLQSLSDNRMTSERIGEKLEEINKLLEEINSEVLREYVEKLQEAMEKLKPEDIRKALEDLNVSAEELLERLKRTASLLEEIRKEQRMEELVRESEGLLEEQRELNEGTGDVDPKNQSELNELSEAQEALADKTDRLKSDIEQFANEVNEPESASNLRKASQELSQKQTSQKMRNASRKLNMGQPQQAQADQQQALEDLVDLFTKMSTAQMAMQSGMGKRLSINLQRIAKQTLRLSFKQEDLAGRIQDRLSSDRQGNLRSLASEQLSYSNALERLADDLEEVARKTLAVSPSLLKKIGESLSRMRNSVLFLDQNKALMSYANASQAVGSLNEATIKLLETSKSCSDGSSGACAGLSALMEQLLAGEQQILQQTKDLLALEMLQEQMRQQWQAELERLAGQQRTLKEIAEEIDKTLDENEGLLGRLDKTIEEMQEVIRDLEMGAVDESTLEKEQRIVSRLLDAQRSVHTRDYEKIRKSVTAEDIFSRRVGEDSKTHSAQTLREAIQRAMKLKAPGEFEDLIRLYFRALAEEAAGSGGSGRE